MKVLFALLMFVFVSYSVQQNPQAPQIDRDAEVNCMEEFHLDLKEIIEHSLINIFNADVGGDYIEKDQKFKCFVKCMLVNKGLMKESGEILVGAIKALISSKIGEEKATKTVETCQKTTATDPCQVAFDLVKCIYIETHRIFSSE